MVLILRGPRKGQIGEVRKVGNDQVTVAFQGPSGSGIHSTVKNEDALAMYGVVSLSHYIYPLTTYVFPGNRVYIWMANPRRRHF
jgi:hypothetical protein